MTRRPTKLLTAYSGSAYGFSPVERRLSFLSSFSFFLSMGSFGSLQSQIFGIFSNEESVAWSVGTSLRMQIILMDPGHCDNLNSLNIHNFEGTSFVKRFSWQSLHSRGCQIQAVNVTVLCRVQWTWFLFMLSIVVVFEELLYQIFFHICVLLRCLRCMLDWRSQCVQRCSHVCVTP